MDEADFASYFNFLSNAAYEEAINTYYTEDALFWNTRIEIVGRQKIIDWLQASHLGYVEKLSPIRCIIDADGAAIELSQEFQAAVDLSHFFLKPLKKGESQTTRGVVQFFRFQSGRICSTKEYRLLYQCPPGLFMRKPLSERDGT